MKNTRLALASLIALGLSACGGGGGGSSTATATTTDPAITISAGNMTTVAGMGASTVDMNISVQQTSTDYVIGAEIQPQAAAKGPDLASLSLALLQKIKKSAPSNALAVGAQFLETYPCANGGSVQYSATIADLNSDTFTPGDKGSLTMNACSELGVVLNGALDFTVVSFVSDLNTVGGSEKHQLTYRDFKITNGAESLMVTGSSSFDIARPTLEKLTGALSSDSLSYTAQKGSQTGTLTLTGYRISFDRSEATRATTTTVSGTSTFNFPALRGRFAVSTVEPITASADRTETGGKVKILGNNSALYLTYLSETQVKIELDSNNDGVIDSTTTGTVAALGTSLWQ